MKYHAVIEYGRKHYYYNFAKDSIIEKLLIPFINGQVILISSGQGKKLLNLKNVTRITFYRTREKLVENDKKTIIQQIQEKKFQKFECTEKLIQETKLNLTASQTYSLPVSQIVSVILSKSKMLLWHFALNNHLYRLISFGSGDS